MFCDQKYALKVNSCFYQLAYGSIGVIVSPFLLWKVAVQENLSMMLSEDLLCKI